MHNIASVLLFASTCAIAADSITVKSPDGQVRFALSVNSTGHLEYAVARNDHRVIEPSRLNISIDGADLGQQATLGKPETYQVDEKYPWRGVHSEAVNKCNGAKIQARHPKADYVIEVRAFNDGVAFRHIVPGKETKRVPDESTVFTLPVGSIVWYHDLGGHYEDTYEKRDVLDLPAGEWAAPPVTFRLPGNSGYASITEAALVNYSGMALQADGQRGLILGLGHKHPISYPFRLRYSNDIERVSQPAAIAGTITTAWRVILIAPDLNTLVNCDIVHNLCPPPDQKLFPDGMKTAWLKPGRAVWKYLDGGPSTFENMEDFTRWAGELGFEHHVIEGFWRRWTDEQLKDLTDFGKKHSVGIWLWRHSKELRDPEQRREFFDRCQRVGAAGVKLDFFDHEAKEVIDFYYVLLREAAERKLMVNFHGANKPTGESRTWPNELIREGVRGMESSRLKERAVHNTTLPFTRFVAGHADYTPVHFGARRGDTTWTHQIATAIVFTEPLLTYGAHPTNILANPALETIKRIPAIWDETIVLPQSAIGEVAIFARRNGKAWFLAVLNGPEARKLEIPLAFLKQGAYQASIVRDRENDSASLQLETKEFRASDAISLQLQAGGGYIARLSLE